MKMRRSFVGAGMIVLLAVALLIGNAEAAPVGAAKPPISSAAPSPTPSGGGINCGKECDRRCSRTWRRKDCLHFCNMCCTKCQCVPSGYSGNRDECPCYNNWKNRHGGSKCP